MKRIALVAAIAVMFSAPVFSQADKPAAAPAAPAMKEEAQPAAPAMKEVAKPAPQKDINIVQGPGQSVVKEDARHCLEHSSNTDIIKCAEPYLPAKR